MRTAQFLRQLLLAAAVLAAPAPAFDLQTSGPAPLESIAASIARAGGFNLLVDPAARRNVTVSLHNVTPEQALARLAREQGLVAQKLEFGQPRKTYVLLAERRSPPPLPPTPRNPGSPIALRIGKAVPMAKLARILSTLGKVRIVAMRGLTADPVVDLEGLTVVETIYALACAVDARIETRATGQGLTYELWPRLAARTPSQSMRFTLHSAVRRDGRLLARLTHEGIEYEVGPGWTSPGGALEVVSLRPSKPGLARLELLDTRTGRRLAYSILVAE